MNTKNYKIIYRQQNVCSNHIRTVILRIQYLLTLEFAQGKQRPNVNTLNIGPLVMAPKLIDN